MRIASETNMTTLTKSLLAFAVVGALAGIVAFFNVSPFRTVVEATFGASPAGTVANTAKFAGIAWAPQSNAASSTSILNTDANPRIILNTELYCNNFGTSPATNNASAVTVQAATTTVANNGLQGNTNYVANFTFSTSTLDVYVSTTTQPVLAATGRVWAAGSYLTFNMNATSTSGTCEVGSQYIQS